MKGKKQMWHYETTDPTYTTPTVFDSCMNRMTEIKSLEWDTVGDDLDPKEVQIVADTDIGKMIFIMPRSFRADDEFSMSDAAQYQQAQVCSVFLNRACHLLGLPLEEFTLFDDKDHFAVVNQFTHVVNKIRAYFREQGSK